VGSEGAAETPVTKILLPLRFTPDSTSSVVEVAPNVLSIFGTSSLEVKNTVALQGECGTCGDCPGG
jgi:hypothetical protein